MDEKQKNKENDHYNTEHGAELAPNKVNFKERRNENGAEKTSIFGYLAILSSIASLFMYPVTLGITGIVLGIISLYSNAKTLGYWAIGIGIVTSVSSLFFKIAILSFILSMF